MFVDTAQILGCECEKSRELPLAFPYVPMQQFENRYSDEDAIIRGTLFPELDLPFKDFAINHPLPRTPMTEMIKIDFVCLELRLYLDTHPNDTRVLEYYKQYLAKGAQAQEKYREATEQYGYNNWVFNPWPWEGQEV